MVQNINLINMTPWYFNPVLVQIGPLQIHWYGLMYGIGFLFGYLWIHYSNAGKNLKISIDNKNNLLLSSMLGVIIGGRFGYILFYNLAYYLSNPLKIFAVWEGGMSFHGGLIGVIIALLLFSKKYKIKFLQLTDVITSIAPVGLFFGRIGNFINAELYGRIASKYCIYFPSDPSNCRYPSQLLESFFEGLILFIILWIVRKYTKKDGIISSCFVLFYGVFRFLIEFFREPDLQIGYILGYFTKCQLLSSFIIIAGIGLIIFLNFSKNKKS